MLRNTISVKIIVTIIKENLPMKYRKYKNYVKIRKDKQHERKK